MGFVDTFEPREEIIPGSVCNDMGHLISKLQACQKCEVAGWGARNQDLRNPGYPGRE